MAALSRQAGGEAAGCGELCPDLGQTGSLTLGASGSQTLAPERPPHFTESREPRWATSPVALCCRDPCLRLESGVSSSSGCRSQGCEACFLVQPSLSAVRSRPSEPQFPHLYSGGTFARTPGGHGSASSSGRRKIHSLLLRAGFPCDPLPLSCVHWLFSGDCLYNLQGLSTPRLRR